MTGEDSTGQAGGAWPPPDSAATGRAGPGLLLPFRALEFNEVLEQTVRLVRAVLPRGFVMVVIPIGILQLASTFVAMRALGAIDIGPMGPFDVDGQLAIEAADVASALAWFGSLWIAGLLVTLVVAAGLVSLADGQDRGQRPTAGDALRQGLERLGATLGATVMLLALSVAALLVGVLLVAPLGLVAMPLAIVAALGVLFVVGVVSAAVSYLIIPVAVMERSGPLLTLRRTLTLARRRFGRLLGVAVVVMLVVLVVSIVLGLLLGVVSLFAGEAGWIVDAVSTALITGITLPATLLSALLVYLDARARLEGYDVATRATDLAARPPWQP